MVWYWESELDENRCRWASLLIGAMAPGAEYYASEETQERPVDDLIYFLRLISPEVELLNDERHLECVP